MGSAAPFSSPGPENEGQDSTQEVEVGNALQIRSDQASTVPAVLQAASVAAAAGAKAAIEARFYVAQMQRRDWAQVERRVMTMCDDPFFAEEAMWSKPQGGTTIEGLSIRFVEEFIQEAGNFHVAAVVLWDDDERRNLQVEVTDLERNNTFPISITVEKYVERSDTKGREVMGSRLNSKGKRIYRVRATEDEVLMKQNSMISKAIRTAGERQIPRNLRAKAIERIKATIRAAAQKDLPATVKKLVAAFAQLNVLQDDLEDFLDHRIQDMRVEEYEHLRGIAQAIKEGEFTWEAVIRKGARPAARPVQPRPVSKVRTEGYEEGKQATAAAEGEESEEDIRAAERQMIEQEGRA